MRAKARLGRNRGGYLPPAPRAWASKSTEPAACAAVRQLALDVGIPLHLSEVGVQAAAFRDVCTPGNPREASESETLAIYRKLF